MYTRQEASLIRKKFWTSFGQYMRPVVGANGELINWLNYKTGIRHLYFRMDTTHSGVSIAIELRQTDTALQQQYFEQLLQLKIVLNQTTGEEWDWQLHQQDEDGSIVTRISKSLNGVNMLSEADWPVIISFLKPRIIALDSFWMDVKDEFG